MIVIHHNPDCSTSRNVLAFLRASGAEPVVIEYLKEGCPRSKEPPDGGAAYRACCLR